MVNNDYKCSKCGAVIEDMRKFGDRDKPLFHEQIEPKVVCKGTLKRIVSGIALSGMYKGSSGYKLRD